ncbi:phage tail spike protein [Peribacillus frigoritolerans]|uniref:phage tail spike protein n=1 Tax=Peribacillus frigoritolerans TaxID=450367 RepID=UPI003305F6FF
MIKGIDVSHWQGSINWGLVAADGVKFAFIKATQGTTYIDSTFKTNISNAKKNGLKVGAYHFANFKSNSEALAEAKFFLNTVKDFEMDLPLVLDIETDSGNIGKSALTAAARTFLEYLISQGRKVMIYTYLSFYKNSIDASGYPLWIARYTTASDPDITGWTVWQYTQEGKVNGITGNVDVNRAIDSFFDNLDTSTPTPEPPILDTPNLEVTGDTTYEVVKDVFLNQIFVENKTTGERVEIVDVVPTISDGLNGKKELSFTISRTEENQVEYDMLVNDNIIVIDEKRFKAQRYFILDIDSDNIAFTKTITASHTYVARLVNNMVNTSKTGTLKLTEVLDIALKGSGFSYVLDASAKTIEAVEQENFGEQNSQTLMDEIVEDYKIELDVDNTKIYVYKQMGKKVNYLLDTRYNVAGLQISSSTRNSTTRAWGYGKQDDKGKYLFDPVLYVHPEEKNYLLDGFPRYADDIRDDRFTKESSIKTALENLVNPYPEVTVNVDLAIFYDPRLEGFEEVFFKGDTISMIADTGGGGTYQDELSIIDIKYNPLDQYSKPELNFSNFRKDIYDMQVDDKIQIKRQSKYIRNTSSGIRNSLPQQIMLILRFDGTKWTIKSSNLSSASVSVQGDALFVLTGGVSVNTISIVINEDILLKGNGFDTGTDYETADNAIKINLLKDRVIVTPETNIPTGAQITVSAYLQ